MYCIRLYLFRKFGRGIKLDGKRIKGVNGNKEIGLVFNVIGLVGSVL